MSIAASNGEITQGLIRDIKIDFYPTGLDAIFVRKPLPDVNNPVEHDENYQRVTVLRQRKGNSKHVFLLNSFANLLLVLAKNPCITDLAFNQTISFL